MATSGNLREIKIERGGQIDPLQVATFFSTIGKLNKKKVVKWEQAQANLQPQFAEALGDVGLIEVFVEMLFKWENESKYLRREETDYLEVFFNNIHLIRQSNIFWRIAPLFWDVGGSYDERWLALFKKHQRAESLNYRNTCFRNIVKHKYPEGHKGYIFSKNIDNYEENYFNKIGINDEVKLYRAFQVRQGKPVRKGVRKVIIPTPIYKKKAKEFLLLYPR